MSMIENYKPIPLMYAFSKILEKSIYNSILPKINLLNIHLLNKNFCVLIAIMDRFRCDISKAFDKVNYQGFSPDTVSIFKSYV